MFVQISDENVHHVREMMDEIFGSDNFISEIIFRKTTGKGSGSLDTTNDFALWYAKKRRKPNTIPHMSRVRLRMTKTSG